MNLRNYYQEKHSPTARQMLSKFNNADHKTDVWNAFVDSDLAGINDDDFSIFPRLLPLSYLPVIKKTAKDITTFCMRLLSLPEEEVRAIVPPGPIRDYLIDELKVLRFRPQRLTGSFRFDMAIVGPPYIEDSLKLLEINEIGFDGLARSTFFQKALLSLMPELKNKVVALDTAAAEIRNMKRLGSDIARIQYDCYNWDEEYLVQTGARMGENIHLVCPAQFGCKVDAKDFPLLKKERLTFPDGRVRVGANLRPDAVNFSFAYSLSDFKKGHKLYSQIVQSKTPQYGPFITGLVASKMILVLLYDTHLRRKLLGSSRALEKNILPAFSLEGQSEKVLAQYRQLVLKHADGFGGEQVFMGSDIVERLSRISRLRHHEWVLQKKTLLNAIDVNGILSRPKRAISDLGVFVHYDWEGGRYRHFELGGLMCRATNKGLKVNVSSGGLQVAVMMERGL